MLQYRYIEDKTNLFRNAKSTQKYMSMYAYDNIIYRFLYKIIHVILQKYALQLILLPNSLYNFHQ